MRKSLTYTSIRTIVGFLALAMLAVYFPAIAFLQNGVVTLEEKNVKKIEEIIHSELGREECGDDLRCSSLGMDSIAKAYGYVCIVIAFGDCETSRWNRDMCGNVDASAGTRI